MVMRVPHTEDLRRADIGEYARERKEGEKEEGSEEQKRVFSIFFPLSSFVEVDFETSNRFRLLSRFEPRLGSKPQQH